MTITEDTDTQYKSINNVIPFIPEGDFYFSKGVDAFYKRKFDIALKWLKKATEADPEEALYPCQISIIYTEIGSYHTANQILTGIIKEHGKNYPDCYYLIANNYAHLGLLKDAKKYADLYLKNDPTGEFKEETEQLLTVLDIGADDEDDWLEEEDELLVYQETAFYHLEKQEWELAMPLLQEMMALFPDHQTAKHEYCFALFYAGDQEEAIRIEEKWLEKDPQSIFVRTNLILFYYERQEFEKAELLQETITNIYPIHEELKLRIATTLAQTKYYQSAYQRFLRLAKSKVKGHMRYYKYFSITAYQVGDKFQAERIWKEGCKQHPLLKTEPLPWELDQ